MEAPPDTKLLPADRARDLRDALGAWYARERRDLPWRRTRDPYAIWISEAMLQQTRVETVIPYWSRFLERFPTVRDLAAADEDALLAAWSGLGYYRRARSLRTAAMALVERFDGRFPERLEDALSLPGVGPYTAGAVLSIAYDRAVPVVDGNVLRVFSRWFALEDPLGSSALTKRAWRLAAELVPGDGASGPGGLGGPGAWNQAVMELGATICTARSPRCLLCPVVGACEAHARGLVERLPRPGRRVVPLDVELEILVVAGPAGLLLRRRPSGGRMAGMWECPTRELVGEGTTLLFDPGPVEPCRGGELVAGEPLVELRHGITRHRIRAVVRTGEARIPGRRRLAAPFAFHALDRVADLALTGMTRKLLRRREVRAYLADFARRA
jgi:A/G-specific adenine glycosylase